jgi:hypothetical protein
MSERPYSRVSPGASHDNDEEGDNHLSWYPPPSDGFWTEESDYVPPTNGNGYASLAPEDDAHHDRTSQHSRESAATVVDEVGLHKYYHGSDEKK